MPTAQALHQRQAQVISYYVIVDSPFGIAVLRTAQSESRRGCREINDSRSVCNAFFDSFASVRKVCPKASKLGQERSEGWNLVKLQRGFWA